MYLLSRARGLVPECGLLMGEGRLCPLGGLAPTRNGLCSSQPREPRGGLMRPQLAPSCAGCSVLEKRGQRSGGTLGARPRSFPSWRPGSVSAACNQPCTKPGRTSSPRGKLLLPLNLFLEWLDFVTEPWPGLSRQVFQAARNRHRQGLADVSL